jgi:hypothetical protein
MDLGETIEYRCSMVFLEVSGEECGFRFAEKMFLFIVDFK